MDDAREKRLLGLFGQALDLPAAKREDWIRRACADDAELLARLRGLLVADADDGDPLHAESDFYPVLLSAEGYENIFGYVSEPVGHVA